MGSPGQRQQFDEKSLDAEIKRAGLDPDRVHKGAHFVYEPGKYEEFRVPAMPSGRDIIVRRVKDRGTGLFRTVVQWVGSSPLEPHILRLLGTGKKTEEDISGLLGIGMSEARKALRRMEQRGEIIMEAGLYGVAA